MSDIHERATTGLHDHAGHGHGGHELPAPGQGVEGAVEFGDAGGRTATAQVLPLAEPLLGTLSSSADTDVYAVELVAGQSYTVTLDGVPGANELADPVLRLYDESGTFITENDDRVPGIERDSTLVYTATRSGTYYVEADGFAPDGNFPGYVDDVGDYRLRIGTGIPEGASDDPVGSLVDGFEAPRVVDVHFAAPGLAVVVGGGKPNFVSTTWEPHERAAALRALSDYSRVANVDFRVVADIDDADFVLFESGGQFELGELAYWGKPMNPAQFLITVNGDVVALEGVGVFNAGAPGWNAAGLQRGGTGYETLLHEFGHGLGLAHPHSSGREDVVMTGVTGPFGSLGEASLNQGVFTIMGYNEGWVTGPMGVASSTAFGGSGTPMALDVAAVQQIYGARAGTNAGDDIYRLPAIDAPGTFYEAVWDTGGRDTIVAGSDTPVVIDLLPATLDYTSTGGGVVSFARGVHGGFTIAAGVEIEGAIGGAGADVLRGSQGSNVLVGGAGDDVLVGRGGNDLMLGGAGADRLIGGPGADTASYADMTDAVTVNLTNGFTGRAADGDVLVGIEGLVGGGGDDVLIGTAGGQILSGGAGDDLLAGRAGDDRLVGEAGDDRLVGGAGNDRLVGGLGNDRLIGEAGRDTLLGGVGGDALIGGADGDVLLGGAGDDAMFGGAGNDVLVGGAGADRLDGGLGFDLATYAADGAGGVRVDMVLAARSTGTAAGDVFASIEALIGSVGADALFGSAAADRLTGGAGNDVLVGRGGDDVLLGGAGNDVLAGSAGADLLIGGAGADLFTYAAPTDSSAGADRIVGFERGTDRIVLARIDADVAQAGDQAFVFVGAAAFSGTAGELRAVAGAFQADVDGDGVADFAVRVGGFALEADDFVL